MMLNKKAKKFCKVVLLSVGMLSGFSGYALESFVVQRIQVVGLQRIQVGTVLNYLPLQVGDKLQEADTATIIRALYNTGFFDAVELDRSENTLVIRVIERPTIASVNTHGNKDISSDDFKKVLKQVGLVAGEIYRPAVLENMQNELKSEYIARGKYNTEVVATATNLPRNRVAIQINITEGHMAKIRQIKIIGNEAFREKTLLRRLSLTHSNLTTILTKDDQFSQEKMQASLESLRTFYLDRGYLHFQIVSQQVSLSPDKKKVYITIKVQEGVPYKVSGVAIKGDSILTPEETRRLIPIQSGEIFSRRKATAGINNVGLALGDKGYGFAKVQIIPAIDEEHKTVFLTYLVEPGQRYYVRRIVFSGNNKTADYVLRYGVRQNEGAVMSVANIKESERQLRLQEFIQDVQVKTVPVPGTNNQVDLDMKVKERPSTVATAGVGYGTDGFSFNAGLNQRNFMGTGRTVGLNFLMNPYGQEYNFNYFNPFYMPNGIGRGFNLYYRKFDPNKRINLTNYTTDRIGGAVNYLIPMNEGKSQLNLGYGFEHLQLDLAPDNRVGIGSEGQNVFINYRSRQSQIFSDRYGDQYNQIRLTAAWVDNHYDQFPYPNHGYKQAVNALISLPASSNSLSYYKTGYEGRVYIPLFRGFILSVLGGVAYGNGIGNTDGLPFFENYFAGGIGEIGQIRGYDTYSLGPKDTPLAPGIVIPRPLGGNLLLAGSTELILPKPISGESYRTSLFLDAGNVYTVNEAEYLRGRWGGGIRASTGVALNWRSPLGPISFSLAYPFNAKPAEQVGGELNTGDHKDIFQFAVSSGF